jgi:hypothetical protein
MEITVRFNFESNDAAREDEPFILKNLAALSRQFTTTPNRRLEFNESS